ncbi:uncharacterized protein KZ484_024295 [Pholidichthys leucotaenia]
MHPSRSAYSHRRDYSDRSSRQLDEYSSRQEERRESHGDPPRNSYNKYGSDSRGSKERKSKSGEYEDSPQKPYSKNSVNRDWSRKSPMGRCTSSPIYEASERKRPRFSEEEERDYRYRYELQEKSFRLSPDDFSRKHVTRSFSETSPQEEVFRYGKSPQDSRHGQWNEEFTYRQRDDDVDYRQMSDGYKDRDNCEWSQDRSRERPRSPEHSSKNYVIPRERNTSPPTTPYQEDYGPDRMVRVPLNGSVAPSYDREAVRQATSEPAEQKATKGFQRFLDVLNKGVNVDILTKIVTQPSEDSDHIRNPQSSFITSANRSWSPGCSQRNEERWPSNSPWIESEVPRRVISPPPQPWSLSPRRWPPPDENPMRRSDDGPEEYTSKSRSPPLIERKQLSPDDEHKHRQMKDVLQAIGMDLGFEELGQMSHRIQERLYGRKDGDSGRKEAQVKKPYSPKRQSKTSSSSKSSYTPPTQDYYMKRDLYSPGRSQGDERQTHQVHQYVEYSRKKMNSISVQGSRKSEAQKEENTSALQDFSPTPTYPMSMPPPSPLVPSYPPVTCPPPPILPFPPPVPPAVPPVIPPIFLPSLPPFLPYPGMKPMNMPAALHPPAPPLFPPALGNLNPQLYNLPAASTFQSLNTAQKSKTRFRHRCLQEIEIKTKQPK